MEPHLVALDVDGTIVTHAGELGERTREAIRAVADAGHEIVISTGRSVVATLPIQRLLDLQHGFAVCSNGGVTLRLDPQLEEHYEVTDRVSFDPAHAQLGLGSILIGLLLGVAAVVLTERVGLVAYRLMSITGRRASIS